MNWRLIMVAGLTILLWAAVAVAAVRGREWQELAGFAAFGTLCLSGFEVTARRRGQKETGQ